MWWEVSRVVKEWVSSAVGITFYVQKSVKYLSAVLRLIVGSGQRWLEVGICVECLQRGLSKPTSTTGLVGVVNCLRRAPT